MSRRAALALALAFAFALVGCGAALPAHVEAARGCLEGRLKPHLGDLTEGVIRDVIAGHSLKQVAFDNFLNTQDLNRVRDAVLACAPKVTDS